MKLDTTYLKKLIYDEKSLKDIEIEMVTKDDEDPEDDEQNCGIGIKNDKPLTENALKQLCSYLKIPYPFTKQLRAQGRTNVLSYIQRQLSQATLSSVILVSGEKSIVSITDEEKLHYKGSDILTIHKRMTDAIQDSDLELSELVTSKGELNYILFYKTHSTEVETGDKWRWGFMITFSALGEERPNIQVVVKRMSDVSLAILPSKTYSYPLEYHSDVEDRWNAIAAFIKNPPDPSFSALESAVVKLKITTASYREIKESRSKLGKLKVDKEDTETLSRINNRLQISKINKEYNVKDLSYVPTKLWYSRATTPLKLFEVYKTVTQEATSAPNTVAFEIRKNLYIYAGNLLMGTPDLSVEQTPPSINW